MNVNIGKIENSTISIHHEKSKMQYGKRYKFMIVVITPIELKTLLTELENAGKKTVYAQAEGLFYIDIEGFGTGVCICQAQMGATGPASVMNIVSKAIVCLKPEHIIMCGIAFGFDEKKTALGDVVVSRQVWNYEPAKIVEGKRIYRGDKVTASGYLLQCFTSAEVRYELDGKNTYQISQGLYASGEKLVNDLEFRNVLLTQEPELRAGDMETAGLASVCESRNVDWITVKGISDLGYKKSDESQSKAAQNAASFVVYTLQMVVQ